MEFAFSLDPLVSSSGPGSELNERSGAEGEHVLQAWSWQRVERVGSRGVIDGVWGTAIDAMGKASAAAQALKAVITTHAKFSHSSDRIYLHLTPSLRRVNGLLHMGRFRLQPLASTAMWQRNLDLKLRNQNMLVLCMLELRTYRMQARSDKRIDRLINVSIGGPERNKVRPAIAQAHIAQLLHLGSVERGTGDQSTWSSSSSCSDSTA